MMSHKTFSEAPAAGQIQVEDTSAVAQVLRCASSVHRSDHVCISNDDNDMAAAIYPVRNDAEATLSASDIATIRARVTAGVYQSPQVLDATVRRMLTSGDLLPLPRPHTPGEATNENPGCG